MVDKDKYQENFSAQFPEAVYSTEMRGKKARTILAIIRNHFGLDLGELSLLDIGSSAGVIADFLSAYLRSVVGIDIDREATAFARRNFRKENLHFALSNALELAFPNNSFDLVICAHIYEHVPDPKKMMNEIYRVLKPGGVCYFAACNKLSIKEPHYNLPFLSILPKYLAHHYLRLAKKGNYYYENLLTTRKIRNLVCRFTVIDYTKKVVASPETFHVDYMIKAGTLKFIVANFIVRYAYFLCPSYIWLLRKADSMPGPEES